MSGSINFTVSEQVSCIESIRNSRVLILAASNLEMEMLPTLYQYLLTMGKVERLDVVLHSSGGVVNAARRIALLLRKFTHHLCFIVPYHCESSATILTLIADEIIAGELSIFTPIDPHLYGGSEGDPSSATSLSCLDIKKFGEMGENWFGVNASEAREQSLSLLCNSIFPPTLTAFYRTTLELQQIGEELISYQLPNTLPESRAKIIKHLMYDYHTHNYAITRDEMKNIGLNIRSEPEVEDIAWDISLSIQSTVGGALRESMEEPWYDMLLADKNRVAVRQKRNDGFMPKWTSEMKK